MVPAQDFKALAMSVMDEFNSSHKTKIDVVLFKYALVHLARVCRIIACPGGSGLLVGVGGSGRQSLTRLGNAIMGSTLFQPEITKNYGVTDWRDDLKQVLSSPHWLYHSEKNPAIPFRFDIPFRVVFDTIAVLKWTEFRQSASF